LDKKIFGVYLAKQDAPDSEANVRLKLPASPWELHDAMNKVQLQENEELYLEVDDYYDFEYLAPQMMLPLAGFTQRTILFPNWTTYLTACLKCWTLPVSEE